MCGASGSRPARVADAVTRWSLTLVAPVTSVTGRLRLVVLTVLTSAADSELFCTVTPQVEVSLRLMVLGSQLCDRVTTPCRLKNATGRCRSRGPPTWFRLIRPKYCPSATAGAEILRSRLISRPGPSTNELGRTEIEVPAGDWVLTLLVTFLALLLVEITPGMVGAFTEGVLRSIRCSGSAPAAA